MRNSTIEDIEKNGSILLKTIAGSHLYGLNHADSDIDIRGIFITHKDDFFGLDYIDQIQDPTNDVVYYELKRFVELAYANNPNILEVLAAEGEPLLYKSLSLVQLKPELFLSKLCKDSFCGYAMGQIKKARGLNKKIMSPQPKERKDLLEFCYVIDGYKSIPLWEWLYQKYSTKDKEKIFDYLCKFGLSKVENGDGLYAMFLEEEENFRGILSSLDSTQFRFSSIPKAVAAKKSELVFFYNHNGFQVHCKHHKEYWEWVENRNPSRYLKNQKVGKGYDTKNMMHTFRLLAVGKEIATEGKIQNNRANIDRDFLLSVRNGEFEYEALLKMADIEIQNIERLYRKSQLPDAPDKAKINKILKNIYHNEYEYR